MMCTRLYLDLGLLSCVQSCIWTQVCYVYKVLFRPRSWYHVYMVIFGPGCVIMCTRLYQLGLLSCVHGCISQVCYHVYNVVFGPWFAFMCTRLYLDIFKLEHDSKTVLLNAIVENTVKILEICTTLSSLYLLLGFTVKSQSFLLRNFLKFT